MIISKLLSSASPHFILAFLNISDNFFGQGSFFARPDNVGSTFEGIIIFFLRWLLGLAGGLAVLFVVISGFLYVTSAGNEQRAEKGKKALIAAVIGFSITILAWVILRVVELTVRTSLP
jgi:hypothetical protein